MKWIKKRNKFLFEREEAKIGDVILPRQKKEFKRKWGEKYLEYEEIEATPNIKQGVWKLSDDDKKKALGAFFRINIDDLYNLFKELPEKVISIVKESIDLELIPSEKKDKFSKVLENFDLRNPSLDEIYLFYENIFRKLSVSETKSDEIILRDETGRPVMGDDKRPVKVKKEKGDPVFSKNLVNLYSFIQDYNNCYPDDKVSDNFISNLQMGLISSVKNFAAEDFSGGEYNIDFGLFKMDMYLSILHNPKDILNMSISKFFASCQHLYTGGYSSQVIGNVFDPNSIPAYLKFDTPIHWEGEKISDHVPLSRCMVRNIYKFEDDGSEPLIYFDRVYPDRGNMESVMYEIIEKYSGNKKNIESRDHRYVFSPDIDLEDNDIRDPYMDRMDLTRFKMIGINTKTLNLSKQYNWSRTIISPKAKIKELIVETDKIPDNMPDIKFNLDFVIFRFLNIKTLSDFKIETKNFGFEKCKLNQNIIDEIKEKGVEKLKVSSCDIDKIDFSVIENLKELHLIYTLEDQSLKDVIGDLKLDKLIISGDLERTNKSFISDLRKSGTKIEIKGLRI
jgi:hypothetical protein